MLLLPAVAGAQQDSGIAGLVRDTTGGVLPGVTVEASSPALIEGVRAAITDGQGRYNVIDLLPGAYVVTFRLPGFNTIRREGIELTAGFTAPVNVQMQVGSLEETITVTAASPQVDVQNVRQQEVVSQELLSVLDRHEGHVDAHHTDPRHDRGSGQRRRVGHLQIERPAAEHRPRQGRHEIHV